MATNKPMSQDDQLLWYACRTTLLYRKLEALESKKCSLLRELAMEEKALFESTPGTPLIDKKHARKINVHSTYDLQSFEKLEIIFA